MATYRIEPAFDSVDVALERFDEEAMQFAGNLPDAGAPASASTDERHSEQHA
ncbi:hypothetical protein [Microbacterium terregens]|uniref:Uncharacterized protein n=1 Tax=Microbacterium terregens TaxID=69363 RepID=A0ABV5SWS6_9MICO